MRAPCAAASSQKHPSSGPPCTQLQELAPTLARTRPIPGKGAAPESRVPSWIEDAGGDGAERRESERGIARQRYREEEKGRREGGRKESEVEK